MKAFEMRKPRGGEAGELYRLGKAIGEARRHAGLTQRELAVIVGVAKITVSQYEIGVRAPSLLGLCRICYACGIPVSMFMSVFDDFVPPFDDPRAAPLLSRPDGPKRALVPTKTTAKQRAEEFWKNTLRQPKK